MSLVGVALGLLASAGPAWAQGSGEAPPAPAAAPAPAAPPPALPPELAPSATSSSAASTSAQPGSAPRSEEREKDSRLSELFWVVGEVGPSYANMQGFSADKLLADPTGGTNSAIVKDSGAGIMAGVGLGLRITVVSLGAKLRWHRLSPFNLVQLNGELMLKIPVSRVDVLVGLHGGYSGVGSLGDLFSSAPTTTADTLANQVSIKGWNAGLDLGFDIFANNYFSLGLGVSGDFLFLQRPKSDLSSIPAELQDQVKSSDYFAYDGKSVGFGITGALRVGLHLGP